MGRGTEASGRRTIGLDGVDAQFENYRRKGFAPAYRTVLYKGRIKSSGEQHAGLERITPRLLPDLLAFDRLAFGARREAFLAGWIGHPHIAFAAMTGDLVVGYAVARKCRDGWKVGPLFAEQAGVAIGLLDKIALEVSDELAIDVPEMRVEMATYLKVKGLVPVFETTRMYLGSMRPLHPSVFGVTTLELG